MIRINQLKLKATDSVVKLKLAAAKVLRIEAKDIATLTVVRRSIDARKKPDIYFSYTVMIGTTFSEKQEEKLVQRLKNRDVSIDSIAEYREPKLNDVIAGVSRREFFKEEKNRPVVVGFGPAGMFAALLLARAGMHPIVFERGADVDQRIRDVQDLWEQGKLHTESNPQFGEGGAGTFSDGKINTLVKDKDGRSSFVLNLFVGYGADSSIIIDAKPHVGTDRLVDIVKNIRREIEALGGEIRFNTKFTYDKERDKDRKIVLAIGHSARDTYEELYEAGLEMQAKDFAMGFRVQHDQAMINCDLYGEVDEETLKALGQGAYKVTHTAGNGRGVYSFCMCPGGYVVNSSSEEGKLCVNGMSYHARDGKNANAAIIVSVRKSDYDGELDPLGGIKLQRELEKRAYGLLDGKVPVQTYGDFKKNKISTEESLGEVKPEIKGQYGFSKLNDIFRFEEGSKYASLNDFNDTFIEGMESFEHKLRGFSRDDTILSGIEARTSSPVRIPRNEEFESNISGIYPCGEGAGYAGGIMSAAMDGMKTAEALVKHFNSL
ncbi:dehydrogenase [Oribacterium sp. C9]|uniref:NAD(P)/FAD-dependent oxidoreductase n=1 Tax=Oribacterium sp. C9 TaxID=1943579 RepID=UPI00098F86A8|nr:dehydrogenase [Oribacterium sp. C9]OON86031.1 dehydrogenase [Oribacterium sp. C9]